jgi:hypothetical protein
LQDCVDHKEVRASRGGFPSAKYLRQFLRLARRLDVCERQSGAVDLSQVDLARLLAAKVRLALVETLQRGILTPPSFVRRQPQVLAFGT